MQTHRVVMGLIIGLFQVGKWALKGTWKLTIKIGKHFFKLERKDCQCDKN